MEVVLGVLIGILGILGIVSSRLITTFVHEAGHAISALLLTSGPVDMYVGSHGNEKRMLKLRLGRLTIFLAFVIWNLEIGLCSNERANKTWKSLLIILSGPLLSLILGGIFLWFLLSVDYSDGIKFVLAILMISSIYDFFVNMIPRDTPITVGNGDQVYNDGKQFIDLFKFQNLPTRFKVIQRLIDEGNYQDALLGLKKMDGYKKPEKYMYEARMEIYTLLNDNKKVVSTFEEFSKKYKLNTKSVNLWADAKLKLHEYDDVIKGLTGQIYKGKGNYDYYFKRGKALMELGEYQDAMRDFHALTLGAVEDPLALANRAYCQYRLGYVDEAVEDVMQAINHAKKEQGEIYYLGGVILEQKDEEKALKFYRKALSLNYEHHAIEYNISRIEKFK